METIRDTKELKIYGEKDREYNIFYTIEKTSYPYYILTKIEVYKESTPLLNINLSVREYDGHTLGAEYKKVEILSQNAKRIITLDQKNNIIKDDMAGEEEEILYYEKELFRDNIYIFVYDKNIYFRSIVKDKNKRKILSRFNRKKK